MSDIALPKLVFDEDGNAHRDDGRFSDNIFVKVGEIAPAVDDDESDQG